ncbi:twin-arginine translocation signal domain-containing protein, partial [Dietzia sp. DQ11-38-2]|nr:twin-arginine translocation signal domain-containing protein [Dietzia sp. DQ11-38-2]
MPDSFTAPVSRRRFVAVTAVATGLALAGGCALPPVDDEPDPLLALAAAAARD